MQPTCVSAHVHIMNFRGVRALGLARRRGRNGARTIRDCAVITGARSQPLVCPRDSGSKAE